MRDKNRIFPGLLLTWLLFGLITVTALAAAYNLTVIPTQVETEKTYNGKEVNICRIARIEDGEYQLEPAFADSGLTVETIFEFDHTKVSTELAEYVFAKKVPYQSKKTSHGKADFGSVEEGLYLVFPAKKQINAKNPFFIPFLVTVKGEDVVCYPKVPNEPTPPTTTPTHPPSDPSKPPKTSDEVRLELAALVMTLSAAFTIVATVFHFRKKKEEPDEESDDTIE